MVPRAHVFSKPHLLTAGFLESCYQRIDFASSNSQTKFVFNDGTTNFNFGQIGSPSSGVNLRTDMIRIQVRDSNGLLVDLLNLGRGLSLSDSIFNWVWIGDSVPLIEIKKDIGLPDYVVNTNSFTFGDTESATITTYSGMTINETVHISFINDLSSAFQTTPANSASCYKFNPFSMDFSTLLDDLCEGVDIELSLPQNSPAASYFPPNYSYTDNGIFGPFSVEKTINISDNIPFGNWCHDACYNIGAPPGPEPVPCGCVDFNLKITLKSCKNCPDLDVNTTIPICCSCDIRGPYPEN